LNLFIEIIIDRKNIIVGTVYRPNSYPKADIDVFMHTMNELQHLLGCEHKEVYIMGDMNIDLLNFTSHKTNRGIPGKYINTRFSASDYKSIQNMLSLLNIN